MEVIRHKAVMVNLDIKNGFVLFQEGSKELKIGRVVEDVLFGDPPVDPVVYARGAG